jgi:hypothetical protein
VEQIFITACRRSGHCPVLSQHDSIASDPFRRHIARREAKVSTWLVWSRSAHRAAQDRGAQLTETAVSPPVFSGGINSGRAERVHVERQRKPVTGGQHTASYSGCPGFKSRPGDPVSWLKVSVAFLSPSRQIIYVKLSNDCFLWRRRQINNSPIYIYIYI